MLRTPEMKTPLHFFPLCPDANGVKIQGNVLMNVKMERDGTKPVPGPGNTESKT